MRHVTLVSNTRFLVVALLFPAVLAACAESPTQPTTQPSFAAQGAAPGQNKPVCVTYLEATCTLITNGAKGMATLSIINGAAWIYFRNWNASFYGVQLPSVTMLSFTYIGTPTPGTPGTAQSGSPMFSLPIDWNDDGYTEAFALIPAISCNNGAGLADVINDPTCHVYLFPNDAAGFPDGFTADWENWAAFAAAHPTWEVSEIDLYAILSASEAGTWTVDNVVIGKPGK